MGKKITVPRSNEGSTDKKESGWKGKDAFGRRNKNTKSNILKIK